MPVSKSVSERHELYSDKVIVEALTGAKGEPVTKPPLTFEVKNHDDILAIAERAKGRAGLDDDNSAALAISLKLFSEVMLMNRKHPLFADIHGPFREFIQKFKATGQE